MKIRNQVIIASTLGNVIETFDLTIYPFLTVYLAKVFFPHQNAFVSSLNVLAIFLFGYLARPVGSLIFGYIGDIHGRKKALMSSALLMLLATGCISLLPSYYSIGIAAPILLCVFRILQGISYGGEISGSVIYLVEHAKENQKYSLGSFASLGSNLGILLSTITCLTMTSFFSEQQIVDYLWRIPFSLSLVFSVFCFLLRSYIYEPNEFKNILASQLIDKRKTFDLLKNNKSQLALIIGLTWLSAASFFLLFVSLTPYLTQKLHYSITHALLLNTLATIILVAIIPFAGRVADKVGPQNIVTLCIISLSILIFPYLYILSTTKIWLIIIMQLAITLPAAFYYATVPVLIVELIQTSIRYRVASFGYNIAAAIFGGTTPLLVLVLTEKAKIPFGQGWYLIICAIVAFMLMLNKQTLMDRVGLSSSQF